jgi:hypothetical protein
MDSLQALRGLLYQRCAPAPAYCEARRSFKIPSHWTSYAQSTYQRGLGGYGYLRGLVLFGS